MKKMVLFLSLSVYLLISVANAQEFEKQRKKTISLFVKAVLNDTKNNKYIIDNYIMIVSNDSIGLEPRIKLMSSMIDSLRDTYRNLLHSSSTKIVSYDKFNGKKQYFRTSNDIEIITLNDIPVLYFYFYREKIRSFYFIRKGVEGYFIIP